MTANRDMPELLRSFLIQHKHVSVPGLGSFHLVRKPATHDIASRKLLAPEYSIHFDALNDSPDRQLFAYVSRKMNLPEWEAIGMVNQFALELKDKLKTGKHVHWEGIGDLETIPGGQVILRNTDLHYDFLPHVSSNRVIRKEVAHTVLVGERERSSDESPQWLEEDVVVAKAGWWVAAVIIAAIALIMIFFQFFRNDYSFVSGKQTPVVTTSAQSQYEEKTLP
jgi:nucleoid DNA-binding protein